jgi:hypothetical protein
MTAPKLGYSLLRVILDMVDLPKLDAFLVTRQHGNVSWLHIQKPDLNDLPINVITSLKQTEVELE